MKRQRVRNYIIVVVVVMLMNFLIPVAHAAISSKVSKQSLRLNEIKKVKDIFLENNGHVCVEDRYGDYYLLDESGNVVCKIVDPSDLAPGENSFFGMDSGKMALYNMEGEVLRTFDGRGNYGSGVSMISSVHEGLIFVEEIVEEPDEHGSYYMVPLIPSVVYYDEKGTEVMRFDGMACAGVSSCFHEGRAFLCQLTDTNSPTNWHIIDREGKMSQLTIANMEILNSDGIKTQLLEIAKSSLHDDAYVLVKGCEVFSVHPFFEGEEYASCLVEVDIEYYGRDSNSWIKDYRVDEYSYYVPSYVDKNGYVFLGNHVFSHATKFSDYVNGCVIFYSNIDGRINSVVDLKNGTYWGITEHPLYIEYTVDGYSPSVGLFFLDDGNFFLSLYDKKYYEYHCYIIKSDGTVVEGPHIAEEGLPTFRSSNRLENYFSGEQLPEIYSSNMNFVWRSRLQWYEGAYIERDGLYPKSIAVGVSYAPTELWGYADIWGNMVIEPQYYKASRFDNGYAYVCTEVHDDWGVDYGNQLIMIDRNGNQVNKVEFKSSETEYVKMEGNYSPEETVQRAEIILETDTQFRVATNVVALPVGVGETCGYLYDIATFDLPGLIKHIYSDVTYQYRVDAARIIAQSLLGEYDEMELAAVSMLIQEYVKSDEYKNAKDYKDVSSDLMDLITKLNGPDSDVQWFVEFGQENLKAFNRFLSCMKQFGAYVDKAKESIDDRLVLYLLASNYEKNSAYVQKCIANCDPSNEEMLEIYKIVEKDLYSMYVSYIQNAAKYMELEGMFDVLFSEASFDTMTWLLGQNGVTLTSALQKAEEKLLQKKGLSKADAAKTANFYFLAHSLVVQFAEDIGTKDTYKSMQNLYENALVVNAMVQELSPLVTKAKNNPQYYEKDVIPKAIALGEYRLIVLDNLEAYYNANWSAEQFLDLPSIAAERLQIQSCLDHLTERQKMLD